MKKSFFSIVIGCIVFSSVSLQAYWIGNPARPVNEKKRMFDLVYDVGRRDVKNVAGGPTSELKSRRLFLQGHFPVGDRFQIVGRLLPGTGRANFENNSFNPHVVGGGVGLQFSPPEALGPLHVGAVASWDWNFGSQDRPSPQSGHDKVDWAEGTVAAGVSAEPIENLSVFGGLSLVKPDIHTEISGTKTNLESDDVFGGFLGIGYEPSEAWILGMEAQFVNERALGFTARYQF